MSAVRLCVARLAPLVAFAALSTIVGCTRPTPLYCNNDPHNLVRCVDRTLVCNGSIHTCEPVDGAIDVTIDASTDTPTDQAPGDTGSDAPTDTPSTDASDAPVDVFHGCVNNNGCSDPNKPVCQTDGGVCVGCLANSDCTTMGARACDTTMNKCVECVVDGDCTSPTRPVCDNQVCRGCKVDSECASIGPGVCMFHLDSRCATDAETVYVAPSDSNCSDSAANAGSSKVPFCSSQAAVDATAQPAPPPQADAGTADDGGADGGSASDAGTVPASPRALVVMRGGSLTEWSFNVADRTLTVVGQASATVSPGGHVGVHVSAGTVYVRSLRVTGGGTAQPGVAADGGELHLDRCSIDNNGAGGIQIDGAGYEITNSIVAANGVGTFPAGPVLWSGVLLGAVPAGKPSTFLNNTVVGNSEPGVICTTGNSHNVAGSILFGNAQTTTNPTVGCNYAACCSGDPGLTTTYRLTATSVCKDQLAANMSTAYDIDGNPRPSNTLSDCGADEFVDP
jgi:hypothetical protein